MSVVRSIVGGVLLLASVPVGLAVAVLVVGQLVLMAGVVLIGIPVVGVAVVGLYLLRPSLLEPTERKESFPSTVRNN